MDKGWFAVITSRGWPNRCPCAGLMVRLNASRCPCRTSQSVLLFQSAGVADQCRHNMQDKSRHGILEGGSRSNNSSSKCRTAAVASILSRWRPNQRMGISACSSVRDACPGDGWTPRGQKHAGPRHHRDDDTSSLRRRRRPASNLTWRPWPQGPDENLNNPFTVFPMRPFHPPPGNTIRLLLVDDHTMLRQGLRSLLESYEDVVIVGEGSSGRGSD